MVERRQPAKPYRKPSPAAPDPRFAASPSDIDADAEPADATEQTEVEPARRSTRQAAATRSLQAQQGAGAPLSPAAQQLQRELARVERLKAQLAQMESIGQGYLNGSAQRLQPLRERLRQAQRGLALALAPWLEADARGLSRAQQATARRLLCRLAQQLAERGDTDMAALHDRYSPQSLSDLRRAAADALRERLSDWLEPDDEAAQAAASPDELLGAARRQWQAQTEAQRAQREARQAKREARKAQREPAPAALLEQQAQQDAGATLRTLYRQLASALHPDRAGDEAERQRMTALMSAANAAYGRRDLLALLDLQLQAELADPDHLERLSAQRLQAVSRLLKEQAASLERERQGEQQRWLHALDLPAGSRIDAAMLGRRLEEQELELLRELRAIEAGLEQAGEPAGLKAWLNRNAG
ncbi:hypothetical protein C6P61_01925 [Malikia spinosa]|uniref:Molecular chaperone DnaJ n=1 Tax=Malikia spinosa TaxID=86180 RepID=A0A2S9KIP3_9BURK|nr:hypothetical protein [Malikia spinosa]PRD70235.1 hypothetical protein C6P61_01925 [Malikia spinosa]